MNSNQMGDWDSSHAGWGTGGTDNQAWSQMDASGPNGPSTGPQPPIQQPMPQYAPQPQPMVQPMAQPQPMAPYMAVPVEKQSSSSGLGVVAAVLGTVLVLLIAVGAGYFVYSQRSGSGSVSNPAPQAGVANAPAEQAPAAPNAADRAANFSVPGSWRACGGSGSAGDLNLYYAGTSVTSCPFAGAVRDALVDHYTSTGSLNGAVTAYSTVTGRSYVMSCSDNGTYVTCTGGNNAVVHVL